MLLVVVLVVLVEAIFRHLFGLGGEEARARLVHRQEMELNMKHVQAVQSNEQQRAGTASRERPLPATRSFLETGFLAHGKDISNRARRTRLPVDSQLKTEKFDQFPYFESIIFFKTSLRDVLAASASYSSSPLMLFSS